MTMFAFARDMLTKLDAMEHLFKERAKAQSRIDELDQEMLQQRQEFYRVVHARSCVTERCLSGQDRTLRDEASFLAERKFYDKKKIDRTMAQYDKMRQELKAVVGGDFATRPGGLFEKIKKANEEAGLRGEALQAVQVLHNYAISSRMDKGADSKIAKDGAWFSGGINLARLFGVDDCVKGAAAPSLALGDGIPSGEGSQREMGNKRERVSEQGLSESMHTALRALKKVTTEK